MIFKVTEPVCWMLMEWPLGETALGKRGVWGIFKL
jgi:hypothetical protein